MPDTEWRPRYVVRKADWVDGDPIPDDEPVLVIRAQDMLATDALEDYMDLYRTLFQVRDDDTDPVLADLAEHRKAMDRWRRAHPDRIKRPDR